MLSRYQRQMLLPELGYEGQKALQSAHVLIVGLGGLGSPVALYLAAAGVGELTLYDPDRVDATNLHRQILYTESDIGLFKAEAAQRRLKEVNSQVRIHAITERFEGSHPTSPGLILDGSDNFETRRCSNRFSLEFGIPFVTASLFRFEGQVLTFSGRGGPCYRCVYPEAPRAPNCAEAGVLGPVAGIVGSFQALEAIQILVGRSKLESKIQHFYLLESRWREVRSVSDPNCPDCRGRTATTKNGEEIQMAEVPIQITPIELKERLDRGETPTLLDVREQEERGLVHIGGVFIPLGELVARHSELNPGEEIIVYCHHGIRSLQAVGLLREAGFSKARNLRGGIDRYSLEVDPKVARY